jgi:hypothetical protein
MRFPIRESDILNLSERVFGGLSAQIAEFPDPPVLPEDLAIEIANLRDSFYAVNAARGALDAALKQKDAALKRLSRKVKKDLRYAENITGFDDAKLKSLGWSGRRAKHKLTAPGQPQDLKCLYNNKNQLTLFWSQSPEGGKTAMYRILRRSLDGTLPDGTNGTWREVASSLDTEHVLCGQPEGRKLEFAVCAVNKAGQSIESNTVEITL